jgi:hypothetical protein
MPLGPPGLGVIPVPFPLLLGLVIAVAVWEAARRRRTR